MRKSEQIKQNHHYVWSYYLKQWANGKNIYYVTKKGKVAYDSIVGLAREKGFYKTTLLNEADIMFLRHFISTTTDGLKKAHNNVLDDFVSLSNLSKIIGQSKVDSRKLENLRKRIQHNSLEGLYSIIEKEMMPVLQNLSKGNVDFLKSSQNMIVFCSYVGHQISRTKAFKTNNDITRNTILII